MASSDPDRWTTPAEMERVARVELASLVWKTRAPAAIPYPLSRGGGTCTRLKWLMRPCWNYLQSTPQNGYSIVKDLVGAAGFEPANLLRPRQAACHLPTPRRLATSESGRESFPAKAIELHRSAKCVQKQKGRIFWTQPLEIGNVIPSRSGHPPRSADA